MKSCELVEHVTDSDVKSLAENSVSIAKSCYDLRISSADIQQNGVLAVAEKPTYLDMRHTVVDTNQRNIMGYRESTCD